MNKTFAASASRLAGMACRSLGWLPDEFWQCTPAELASIFAAQTKDDAALIGRDELTALMEQERNG